ncbi:helix-turn-helix domain-containing protein [Candidatus Latescibacterota bacterium]
MSEELLSVIEAARKLNVSPRTIQRYCKQGRLNHKWIEGKRHKELRIVSPIPISQLPGGRRKNLANTFDYVSKTELEEITFNLNNSLEEKDRRIAALEGEIVRIRESGNGGESAGNMSPKKIEHLLAEIEKVRPAERRLVLKLARAIQTHEKFLETLGMNKPQDENAEE